MRLGSLVLSAVIFASGSAFAQDKSHIPWRECPCDADLGGIAMVSIPDGFVFVDKQGMPAFMEATHNPASGTEVGAILKKGAAEGDIQFAVFFSFEEIGYVKDDEKDKLDADAILESIRAGNEEANEVRRQNGWGTLEVTGWERKPFYDAKTNNLTWAMNGKSPRGQNVNYSVRLLGRRGVMNADLVLGPEQLAVSVPEFNKLLEAFTFRAGGRYAEFRSGDKIARYGLTALVGGGVGAAAVKSGLLGKLGKAIVVLWKGIVVGIAALVAFLKRLLSGRRQEAEPASSTP